MKTAANVVQIEAKAEPQTDGNIALLVEENPSIVLKEPAKLAALYSKMKADVAAHVPDLTSEKGRKAIASLAYKIARTKTAIDDAGKTMNDEANKQIAMVNAKRKDIRETLDELRDQVRKPLTDWEEAEDARVKRVDDVIANIRSTALVPNGATSELVGLAIDAVEAVDLDRAVFLDRWDEADTVRQMALASLRDAHTRAMKDEADRAELEKLRAEKEERDRQDAAKREAEAAEARHVEAEKAEQDRIAEAARLAQEEATAAAERKAQADRDALQRQHQAELDKIEAERRADDQRRQAEIDRLAREQAARDAEAKRIADEDAARAANKAHRATVMKAVKEALMLAGEIDEAAAKQIVFALIGGTIPHTSIQF